MLVISIPTNIAFTGNHTRINLHVSGSVEIMPNMLKVETITTETRFCNQQKICPFLVTWLSLHRNMRLIYAQCVRPGLAHPHTNIQGIAVPINKLKKFA